MQSADVGVLLRFPYLVWLLFTLFFYFVIVCSFFLPRLYRRYNVSQLCWQYLILFYWICMFSVYVSVIFFSSPPVWSSRLCCLPASGFSFYFSCCSPVGECLTDWLAGWLNEYEYEYEYQCECVAAFHQQRCLLCECQGGLLAKSQQQQQERSRTALASAAAAAARQRQGQYNKTHTAPAVAATATNSKSKTKQKKKSKEKNCHANDSRLQRAIVYRVCVLLLLLFLLPAHYHLFTLLFIACSLARTPSERSYIAG